LQRGSDVGINETAALQFARSCAQERAGVDDNVGVLAACDSIIAISVKAPVTPPSRFEDVAAALALVRPSQMTASESNKVVCRCFKRRFALRALMMAAVVSRPEI